MAEKKTTTKKKATKKAKPEVEKVIEEPVVETVAEAVVEEKDAPKIDPRDAEIEALKEQIKALMEQMKAPVSVQPAKREMVTFLWQAPVANDNVIEFGDKGQYGQITGATGTFSVPKDELSRVLSADVWLFLRNRWLIVLDGLTDEERELYGVDYKSGEVLDRNTFSHAVDMGMDIVPLYERLCTPHKEIVAKRFYEAWLEKIKPIDREVIVSLRNMSRGLDAQVGAFQKILEEMNAEDEE